MLSLMVYGGTSMDIPQIRKLKPTLKKFLKRLDHCFPRKDTRAHLPVYVSGQLSDIPEKSVEPIAINAGVPPRTLQEFLRHRKEAMSSVACLACGGSSRTTSQATAGGSPRPPTPSSPRASA